MRPSRLIEICFYNGAETPDIKAGSVDSFVLAIRGPSGRVTCLGALYLRDFPLYLKPPEGADSCDVTGWFEYLPADNDEIVLPIQLSKDAEILGWCPMDEISERLSRLQALH